jgi:hypothetical protein
VPPGAAWWFFWLDSWFDVRATAIRAIERISSAS